MFGKKSSPPVFVSFSPNCSLEKFSAIAAKVHRDHLARKASQVMKNKELYFYNRIVDFLVLQPESILVRGTYCGSQSWNFLHAQVETPTKIDGIILNTLYTPPTFPDGFRHSGIPPAIFSATTR